MTTPMLPRERCEFSAIVDRPPLKLPDGAQLVLWTIVNYEVWDIGRPMPRQVLPAPTGASLLPDVPHWSWHEYGMRVGAWRFFELYERLGITPTLAVNARTCEDYARVARGSKAAQLGVHGSRLRPDAHSQGRGPGRHDHALARHPRALLRQASGGLARAGSHPDIGNAGAARRRRREIYRRLDLRRRAHGDRHRRADRL